MKKTLFFQYPLLSLSVKLTEVNFDLGIKKPPSGESGENKKTDFGLFGKKKKMKELLFK